MYGQTGFFTPNHISEYGFYLQNGSKVSFPVNRKNKKTLETIWEEFEKGNDEGYVTITRNDTNRDIKNEGVIYVIVNTGQDRIFKFIQSYPKRNFPFSGLLAKCEVSEL